ncbi:heterogeneous nuclear ribonucleoprotein 27C-like isoform X2 [Babylonia areolata]|uniref:heterogeneous nuclear ribonucleoprotein 27C-like isoform X2 n=1 Tax=Babylonia areolata TaxID=304850 RepID=UPI003FD4620B
MGGREEPGKIFVGGLSWDTDQDSLQGYFSQFGEITDCIVMKNPQTGKSRGFGFVSFKDPSTVQVILSSKNHVIDGRTVDAKACNARGTTPKMQNKFGGGMTGRTTKIFIGGLPNNVGEDTIRDCFSRFGSVTEVVIMYDHEKGRSRGFGFLTFDNEDSVEQACAEHYVDVNGKQVECKKAEPRGAGGRGGGNVGRGGGRGGGNVGGYGGGPQGWGQGGPQGNWNQGWGNQDGYNQQGWGNQQQGWGNQGGYNNGWQGGQGGQQNMNYGGGYGQYQQQGGGGYGDNQQGGGGYGGQQGGYGSQQGGYGGNQPNNQGSNQGMGGGYQQRQAPGNTGGGGGRGSGSQNYHPYSR